MRFIIYHHITDPDHYDFMFEEDDYLVTYSMDSADIESFVQGSKVPILRIADHRLLYLDHEGSVSGNRGSIVTFDKGLFNKHMSNNRLISYRVEGSKLDGFIEINNSAGETTVRYIYHKYT